MKTTFGLALISIIFPLTFVACGSPWGAYNNPNDSKNKTVANGPVPDSTGFVFYDSITATGKTFTERKNGVLRECRYLEAAPSDQATIPTGARWQNGPNSSTITDTAIGAGQGNTEAIVNVQGVAIGGGTYAAIACEELVLEGHSDWFLPSKDELALLYTALKVNGKGGFSNNRYWSSSAQTANSGFGYAAWCQDFGSGAQDVEGMPNPLCVRAVRAY